MVSLLCDLGYEGKPLLATDANVIEYRSLQTQLLKIEGAQRQERGYSAKQ